MFSCKMVSTRLERVGFSLCPFPEPAHHFGFDPNVSLNFGHVASSRITKDHNVVVDILKAYRFKLEPTTEQEEFFLQSVGNARLVWNTMLSLNLWRLESGYPLIWYSEMSRILTLWKQTEELSFLKSSPEAQRPRESLQGCVRQEPAQQVRSHLQEERSMHR